MSCFVPRLLFNLRLDADKVLEQIEIGAIFCTGGTFQVFYTRRTNIEGTLIDGYRRLISVRRSIDVL